MAEEEPSMTKIHGFKKHIVSNFLKDRHPYLHSPFNQRYDPKEVFHAVFDRSIPKLVEILAMPDLPADSYKEAFMLLNEMTSHQENKLTMIDSGLVETSLAYMVHDDVEVRRDATNLLGSLLSVRKGRDKLASQDIDVVLRPMLLADSRECREVCGWLLCRLCSGRDGVDIVIQKDQVRHIVASFKNNSDKYDIQEAMFLIYLLECMASILQTDEGINHIVSTAAMKRFKEILSTVHTTNPKPFGPYDTRIKFLCLHASSLIAMNEEGKEESIDLGMIEIANEYLLHEDAEVANAATKVIMFSSVHLKGKDQATKSNTDTIVKNLIKLLGHADKDIVQNAEISLLNIADLPKGFRIICKYLSAQLEDLDRIFGPVAIVPLYLLLFKVDKPPFLTQENQEAFLRYGLAIAYFINAESSTVDAMEIAIQKTCRIVERLLPLLLAKHNKEAQKKIALVIEKICEEDEVNLLAFQNFVATHGEIHNPLHNTTLLAEISSFRSLFEIYQAREDIMRESQIKINNKNY